MTLEDSDGGDQVLPLQLLLDSAPDGFIVVDQDGSIVWANKMIGEMFGYEGAELAGAAIEVLIPARFHAAHLQHRQGYMASPRVRDMGLGLNLVGHKKNGAEFPLEIRLSPLQTAGGLLVTAIVRDVTRSRELEEERNLLRVELETERERDRIAMDLHDGIMQDIYASTLTLELAQALAAAQPGYADSDQVNRAVGQLRDVIRNIRSYIFDLRPREFSGDLPGALAELAHEFHQNSGIDIATEIVEAEDLPMATAVALYHIAHESLSNIQRHAHAAKVKLSLTLSSGRGSLSIEDDGVGFDSSAALGGEHRGLRNMTSRARAAQAKFSLQSQPGEGTRLQVDFPLRADS